MSDEKEKLRVLDLFSGIGGFSLGLKRVGGFRTVCYVEIEPYCQEVLKARMQDGSLDMAPIWDDVTRFDGRRWRGHVDLICGGFPCQDISNAGKRAGIKGERSGLWGDYARIIRQVQPQYVLVENVSALLARGLGDVLGDLAESGYDAEWDCIPAAAVGAPHRRDRVWILAYPMRGRSRRSQCPVEASHHQGGDSEAHKQGRTAEHGQTGASGQDVAHTQGKPRQVREPAGERQGRPTGSGEVLAHTNVQGLEGRGVLQECPDKRPSGKGGVAHPLIFNGGRNIREWFDEASGGGWWGSEPNVGRVAHGVPKRVDRLRSLGNAVVPQVVEWIGRRILDAKVSS